MKKLMIAAAIVCAAALAQAATFDWVSSKVYYGIDAAEFTSGLVNGKTYTAPTSGTANRMNSEATTPGVNWQLVLAITDAAGTETVSSDNITYLSNKPKVTDTLSSDKIHNGTEDTPVAVDYTWKIVGTWTDGSGNEWTLTSNEMSGSASFSDKSELKLSTSAVPTTWTATTSAVPEPTSAMLLLLGVAGLALKRRRA